MQKIKVNTINGVVECSNCGCVTGEHEFTVSPIVMPGNHSDKPHGPPTIPGPPVDLDSAIDEFVSTSDFPSGLCETCEEQERREVQADFLYDQMKEEGHSM